MYHIHVCVQCQFPDEIPSRVLIKFSGDGAKFSKNSSYVLFTLSLPGVANDVLAGAGTEICTCTCYIVYNIVLAINKSINSQLPLTIDTLVFSPTYLTPIYSQ